MSHPFAVGLAQYLVADEAVGPEVRDADFEVEYGGRGATALPRPGARTGRRCATTLAPASTNSPILFSIFSLIVSVFGSTSNSYSTPPGTTTLPFFTFSSSTARVAQRSYLTPFALGRLIRTHLSWICFLPGFYQAQ